MTTDCLLRTTSSMLACWLCFTFRCLQRRMTANFGWFPIIAGKPNNTSERTFSEISAINKSLKIPFRLTIPCGSSSLGPITTEGPVATGGCPAAAQRGFAFLRAVTSLSPKPHGTVSYLLTPFHTSNSVRSPHDTGNRSRRESRVSSSGSVPLAPIIADTGAGQRLRR